MSLWSRAGELKCKFLTLCPTADFHNQMKRLALLVFFLFIFFPHLRTMPCGWTVSHDVFDE